MSAEVAMNRPQRSGRRPRKSRGHGLRTRLGCTSCRARHVKCTEERPTCRACRRTDRQCEYPVAGNQELTEAPVGDAASAHSEAPGHEPESQSGTAALPEPDVRPDPAPEESQNHDDTNQRSGHVPYAMLQQGATRLDAQHVIDPGTLQAFSPESNFSGTAHYSIESAPLQWFGLLAEDASLSDCGILAPDSYFNTTAVESVSPYVPEAFTATPSLTYDGLVSSDAGVIRDTTTETASLAEYVSTDQVQLSSSELLAFRHFVQDLSRWIDLTDPDTSFSVLVSQMALQNKGLMSAILALSIRHLSLLQQSSPAEDDLRTDRNLAVQYYNKTLSYLQTEMKDPRYLRSEHLLATVLIISTYEMIDGYDKGWERHLKGVFWIQRSQLIHGESGGLKQSIWWAWIRQDIWAAFKERRRILSFYHVARPCAVLDYHELVNRVVFLLGQCVNYASETDRAKGQSNVQLRYDAASVLGAKLDEWYACFSPYDSRLPTDRRPGCALQPLWINPTKASE